MEFFIEMNPPTATAQEKQVRICGGKPIFYDPVPVKNAKKMLMNCLAQYRPGFPLTGALELYVIWLFPKRKSHRHGDWRVTRPDTDNLQKLLKDCMTKCGYWRDDAQVAREIAEKRWSDEPTGIYIKIECLDQTIQDRPGDHDLYHEGDKSSEGTCPELQLCVSFRDDAHG